MFDIATINNNFPPGPTASEVLRASITEELAAAEKEKRQLLIANTRLHDAEVAASYATELAALERGRRDAISCRLDARLKAVHYSRVMLSPIRRIPLEVFGEIFACVLDLDWTEADGFPSPPIADSTQVPKSFMKRSSFVLAAVCKRWREAALSCTRVWSTIRLAVASGESPMERNLVHILTTCLQRAGVSPLRLAIYAWPLNDSALCLTLEIATLLSNYKGEWQRLWLLCNESGRKPLLPLLQRARPMLQSLTLVGRRDVAQQTTRRPLNIFPSLPRLSEAFIQDFALPCGPLPRLEKLTAVNFSRPAPPLFDLLRRCSRLKELTICGFDGLNPNDDPPLPLPYLTSLTTSSHAGLKLLQETPIFPRLIDVVLVYPCGSLLHRLVERADINLTSLHICWPPGLDEGRIHQSSLMALLQSRPALRKLEFDGALPSNVIDALSRPPWPCPSLSTLELHNCGRGDQVMQLVRARGADGLPQGVKALEKVELTECNSISSWEVNEIQTLLQEQRFSA